MENNAGLSGKVPELQSSSRLNLTVPDNKAKALNRGGRTGEMLNPNVKPFLSAPFHTVVTCDERQPSETFYRHESREVRSCGLPGAVPSSGLAPLNVWAGAAFTAPGNEESIFKTYLDRQGQSEYLNLASQIGYNGNNIAFIFFENQIRELMNEAPCDEQRLEALRASCVGQPREMVNLFVAPMKSLSISQRIEMALLRQRYGVPDGLTTEPKIIAIRSGCVISFNVASLKQFNEDLNTLEVFAYAHDEFQKLSGQLLLDVANRLPGTLKRRYLDYLARWNLDLNHPGFDSLREFILHELSVMSSDYAQTFFRSEEKDKPRDSGYGRASVRVRQVAVKSQDRPLKELATKTGSGIVKSRGPKVPPLCFVCDDATSRHFLGSCTKFNNLSMDDKKEIVMNANRCLNCLAKGHFARKCSLVCKCTVCGPNNVHKHAIALHDVFVGITRAELGAAGVEGVCETGSSTENKSGREPITAFRQEIKSSFKWGIASHKRCKSHQPLKWKIRTCLRSA